jgi:hypothetical protein
MMIVLFMVNMLRAYPTRVRNMVQFHINTILYHADMGNPEVEIKLPSFQTRLLINPQLSLPPSNTPSPFNCNSTSNLPMTDTSIPSPQSQTSFPRQMSQQNTSALPDPNYTNYASL